MYSVTIIVLVLALETVLIKADDDHHKQQQGSKLLAGSQPWQTIGTFSGPRFSHSSTLINNNIYIFGGYFANESESIYYSDVQYFTINVADGTMTPGSLSLATSFRLARSDSATTYFNSYVYLIGGYSGTVQLNDVQYAHVESNGQILEWRTSLSNLNLARSKHQIESVTTSSGKTYLVVIGGIIITSDGLPIPADTIEVAEINKDGSLGEWFICPNHLKGGREGFATSIINNYLYVMGGRGDISLNEIFNDVQYASIQNNGCPGPWSTSAHRTIVPVFGHKSVTINPNTFILLGGIGGPGNYYNTVQYSSLHTDDSDTKTWSLHDNPFPIPRYGHTSVALKDTFIYVMGGRSGEQAGYLNDIQMSAMYFFDENSV